MNQLRIIGGKWRSRKIHFPDHASLRPTPDRVRETLFNWLSAYIQDAVCLDLFAGSGALGFEALSRGASEVVMVDNYSQVAQQLQDSADQFETKQVKIYQSKIPEGLNLQGYKFDLIFLDPPFEKNLLLPTLEWLQQQHCLKPHTLIYVEMERLLDMETLLKGWKIIKHKSTRHLQYALIKLN